MAKVVGSRIGLITYTEGSDPRPGRLDHNAERALLENTVVVGSQGVDAERPTAGKGRAAFWNTTRRVLQWDTGSAWVDVSTNGGGPPTSVSAGGTNTEGTSDRSARLDHTHALALATTSTHGAMSAGDKSLLDNATSSATANRLVQRDASGRAKVTAPATDADIANKGYVDSRIGGAAAPVVSLDNNGLATPSMLGYTNTVAAATSAATANTLAYRDSSGRLQVSTPVYTQEAANKSYVDTQINTHRHDASHITSGIFAAARLPIATSLDNGAMTAAHYKLLDESNVGSVAYTIPVRTASGTLRGGTNPTHSEDLVPRQWFLDQTADLRTATGAIEAGTLMKRGTDGNVLFPEPTQARHPATRGYVDTHTWGGEDIVRGYIPRARIGGSELAWSRTTPTTSTWATVAVGTDGGFSRYTSTERHKTNITPWTPEPRELLAVEPSEYNRKDPKTGKVETAREVGVIAERAGKHAPEFVEWGPDEANGTDFQVQGWSYMRWTTAHQVLHRWHAERDDTQDQQIARILTHLGLE